MAVRRYLESVHRNEPKMQVAEKIASYLFPENKAHHTNRCIRNWSRNYLKHGKLPWHEQGKFVKVKSLIHDEDSDSAKVHSKPKAAAWYQTILHDEIDLDFPF